MLSQIKIHTVQQNMSRFYLYMIAMTNLSSCALRDESRSFISTCQHLTPSPFPVKVIHRILKFHFFSFKALHSLLLSTYDTSRLFIAIRMHTLRIVCVWQHRRYDIGDRLIKQVCRT